MEIRYNENKEKTVIALKGRLDTNTAPELEEFLKTKVDLKKKLIFDLKELEYIASAGLRVLLSAQKLTLENGGIIVLNPREEVLSVFDITGFTDMLEIRQGCEENLEEPNDSAENEEKPESDEEVKNEEGESAIKG